MMIWKLSEVSDSIIEEKSKEWKTSKILTKLLLNKKISEKNEVEKFIDSSMSLLRNPFDFEKMEEAVEKIIEKKNRNEKVYIYGDYDVDGISAASFLVRVFREVGIDTGYYIPSRMEETYGFDKKTADYMRKRDGRLVITVDTGANSIEDIRYAKSIGIDIIVTDHHKSVKDKFDEEYIMINPKLSENYKFKYLSGAGVALKLAQALLIKLGKSEDILYKYLDIVMIGTVADVVPMIDENRIIISNGLRILKNTKVKGLIYLLKYLKFQNKNITTTDVSYFISPLINSLGRIGVSKVGADFFIEEDEFKIYNIIEEMKKMNKIRRKLEKKIYDEAIEFLKQKSDYKNLKYIFLTSEEWHPGVIGVVSSRLSIKYRLPVILIATGNGVGKASCRSVAGINIFNIFTKIKEKLVRYGGHDLAAGFIARTEDLPEIEEMFSKEIEKIDKEKEEKIIEVDMKLSVTSIDEELIQDMKKLSPYGLENLQPLFLDENIKIKWIEKFGVEDRHFNGMLEKEGKEFSFIAFNLSNEIENIDLNKKVKIVYYPEKINIKGKDRYNIRVKSIKQI
ncbi:single-stranded-DNA-specific exonuclease RecJ [Fusobacterium perfoetens]|uniref:single-stranded-DNA-specific exonuclease RecJ n=1 Tax=Fusobacterium perfoetens TaxID=852 RepID=UPI000B21D206|nr:single-stranded-DNA-specific exonuclease RecJ [Fusobacterium perfoetens]MCI6152782.1 single-stranded-DNA-specific exonuclease RecJ [Fusobacterium perfoetens]MDY3236676.1 single-stranded-DNA-specific exonuclease RecJ [Fusobacterium perfoetens]